jgi:hypothetical protein
MMMSEISERCMKKRSNQLAFGTTVKEVVGGKNMGSVSSCGIEQ